MARYAVPSNIYVTTPVFVYDVMLFDVLYSVDGSLLFLAVLPSSFAFPCNASMYVHIIYLIIIQSNKSNNIVDNLYFVQ